MRIISGSLRGRQFEAPKTALTHPMGDKVRGALFNTLGDITGLTVLDAYAGSGALGLEAISRGAAHVTLIESDPKAQKTILSNSSSLGVDSKIKLVAAKVRAWSDQNPNAYFDLVLCDPPYDEVKSTDLQKISHHLSAQGVMVLSLPRDYELTSLDGFTQLSEKSYAAAKLVFYRRETTT